MKSNHLSHYLDMLVLEHEIHVIILDLMCCLKASLQSNFHSVLSFALTVNIFPHAHHKVSSDFSFSSYEIFQFSLIAALLSCIVSIVVLWCLSKWNS